MPPMRISIGHELTFQLAAPTPMILMLFVRPERGGDLETPEVLLTDPVIPVNIFLDSFDNKCGRIVAPPGIFRVYYKNICRDSGHHEPRGLHAAQHDVNDLPPDILRFLIASRYCEVDRFGELAWQLFGNTPPGWPRCQAVSNWVHANVQFG